MKLSDAGELSLLQILRKRFSKKSGDILLGIGDDCAVIGARNAKTLLTTDMMIEGVHFDLTWTTPYQIGFKLVSVNVSDIYAMGGRPKFLLLDFAAGKHTSMDFFNDFLRGIGKAMEKYRLFLVGGDISSSEKIMLSATAVGYASRIISRKGAGIGDKIYVTGNIGDSACGLELLKRIKKPVDTERSDRIKFPLKRDIIFPLIKKHLMPTPRNPERFKSNATSMIDISDGLLIDLSRLCKESGVGAKIYLEDIPISDELRKTSEYLKLSPLEFALGGGEDYELLFTARPDKNVRTFCIGEITKSGIKVLDSAGRPLKISIKGYQHFAS
ncbi:MAG: thiamine-phosphate kinase [Nitrospirota bacterium]